MTMPRQRVLLGVVMLLVGYAAMGNGEPHIDRTSCPICDMDVQANIQAPIQGHQHIFACEMAGHLQQLTESQEGHLGSPMRAEISEDPVYQNATEMQCPVCGMGFKYLHYAVAWGPVGNQKIFACSEVHAQMIHDHPLDYIGKDTKHGEFCNMGAGPTATGSVMFNGFQVAVGKDRTCATLLFPKWVLSSGFKYALGLIGVLLLGMSMEAFGKLRTRAEEVMLQRFGAVQGSDDSTPESESLVGNGYGKFTEPSEMVHRRRLMPLWCKIVLALMYALNLSVAYMLMLVAMMYETLFFLAVVVGLALGFFVFSEMDSSSRQIDPCCSS